MAGPTSPGSEGPTFGPPQLPPGWIAQWDGASKKYYFVQLSTGVSQWEVPTDAAPTGSTPAPAAGDHPYGVPRQQELITHPDGSQTVRYADGSLEPVNPSMPQDGSRGLGDGPSGDRGLGSMAMNLLGGKNNGGGGASGSSPLGSLAGQFLGGGGGSGNSGGGGLGKIGGALASSFLSSGNKPDQSQTFHGGNSSTGQHQSHGLAGSIMGGVANMFGGGKPNHGGSSFGYSNNGDSGGYTGQPPPASYQPSGQHRPTATGGNSSYQQPQSSPQQSFPPPPAQPAANHNSTYDQHGNHQAHPSYGQVPPPPAGGPPASSYGHSPSYGAHSQQQSQPQQYGGNYDPSSYGGGPPGGYPNSSHPTYSNGPSQHSQGGYGNRY